jgi:hypothetical protein
LALRAEASKILRPALLSKHGVFALVRAATFDRSSDGLCEALWTASGGNPLYLSELLRAVEFNDRTVADANPAARLVGGLDAVGRRVISRVRRLGPAALRLAQSLAVLGDGCDLRHAAATASLEMIEAIPLVAGLVRSEVLVDDDLPRFIHPVVRDALEASLSGDQRDAAHRSAARLLYAGRAPAGEIAAHLARLQPAGDEWALARLLEAAQEAIFSGAPKTAADLLHRALAERPPPAQRTSLLRRAAQAEVAAGREAAVTHLREALELTADARERAEIALESLKRTQRCFDGSMRSMSSSVATLFVAIKASMRSPKEAGEGKTYLGAFYTVGFLAMLISALVTVLSSAKQFYDPQRTYKSSEAALLELRKLQNQVSFEFIRTWDSDSCASKLGDSASAASLNKWAVRLANIEGVIVEAAANLQDTDLLKSEDLSKPDGVVSPELPTERNEARAQTTP